MSKGTKALAIIVGRLGHAIKIRKGNNDKKIGQLRLACTDGYGDNENTSWFDVVIFDEKKVEVLEKYTEKGSRVMVTGLLRVRKWVDKEGGDRWSTEIVVSFDGSIELMDSKADSPKQDRAEPRARPTERAQPPAFGGDLDDEVPF